MGEFHQANLRRVALLPLLLAWLLNIVVAQTYHCSSTSPCYNGACCGFADGQGICGFGPTYCGKPCISNCSATAECGEYASDPKASCPPNICCSKYGFCGTTGNFCGDGCQGDNCGDPPVPSCGSNNVMKRVIGYYESWASNRACDAWRPNDIAATALTHANYAFAVFKPAAGDASEWVLEYMHGSDDVQSLVSEFIGLKDANPALLCYLAIGGWAFNDPPTASYWSDMASTAKGRHSFAKAVLNQLEWFGFDGVDLDWEYPVADDRGGKPEDKENFVKLVRELREVLDNSGRAYGITFTAPSSYWYLQHFDIPGLLEAGADWTNIMSYDLHGVWDGTDKWIGSIMQAHTNLTEIKQALGLFWRVGVDPSQIVLGTAFYGRSFTASSSDCLSPGCEFSHGGDKGRCTNATGTLSYKEILEAVKLNEGTVTLDKTAAVNYATWGENQWVSFDTNGTFKTKIDYANEMCLGGVMIWSVDQDTYDWEAMSAMLDEPVDSNNLLTGGSMSDHDAKELSHMYSAYTGTNCYVSDCVDWKSGGQCKTGYSVLDYVHAGLKGMISGPDKKLCKTGSEGDDDAEYRLICCPTDAMPEGCTWEGMRPDGFCTGGQGTCGEDKYELVADKYTDRTGGGFCIMNKRSLCCNANKRLSECSWSGCDGTDPDTPKDGHIFEMVSPYSGSNLDQSSETCDGAEVTYFSCPSKDTLKNCKWYGCDDSCPSSKILITQRTAIDSLKDSMFSTCLTGTNKLCCDPPDGANSAPVDPKNLFKYPDEDDVSYYYKEENSSNEAGGDHHKNDPFAFVMIDGDPEAYSESLVDQWTFLTDDSSLQKRGLKLHRRQNMFEPRNDTFENVVEKYHIQCGSLYANETGCEDIFSGGASNTIVKMPKDVGAGPYARVVSLLPWASDTDTRDEDRLDARSGTDTYELTVDYDLPAASKERKGDVNFRVDYTNLLGYWNDITAAPASKQKRWFGPFDDWLKKITTIVKDEKGSLPLLYEDKVKLFHADKYCPNMNLRATFDIDAQIKLGLNAQYGYYFEGAILPKPSLISAYGYFSIEPDAMILMTLRAEAVMQSNSDVIEILRAGFPGLYIKGLISIGPELVLNGQMDASLSVSGELNAGVAVGWSRTEVYFPPDAAAAAADVTPDEEDVNTGSHSFEPIFNAELEAEGNLALTLSPQVRFGVSVLGDKLMSGYVTAGMSNTISLGMNATASGSHDKSASAGFCYWADYNYKIFLRADMSFLDDLAYWGDQVDLTSPKDSITLVEDTCIKYSSDNELDKRGDAPSLVKNGTDAGCFGGMIACSTVQPSVNTTCKPDPEAKSSPPESSKVKRMPYTCNNKPVMWYNCDYFRDQAIPNGNQNTIGTVGSFKTFWGICHNIKAHLQANMGKPGVGSNYMLLHYLTTSDAEVHKNRRKACGSSKPGNSAQCAREKRDLWPVAVQNAHANQNVPGTQDYKLMAGYSESVSCDEFPFNGSEEGGDEARVECVPVEQQIYQGQINGLLGTIVDTTANPPKKWEDSADPNWGGNDPAYYVTLMYGSIDGNNLGIGGRYSQTNPLEVYRILGGINLMGNPDYAFEGEGDNAICHMDDFGLYLIRNLGIKTISVAPCKVIFVDPPAVPVKRDYNPRDPENWVVKDVELSDDWIERGTTILLDDPSALERDVFGHLKNLAGSQSSKRSTEKDWAEAAEPEERNPHRTSRQEHLRRHRHGGIHGHVH